MAHRKLFACSCESLCFMLLLSIDESFAMDVVFLLILLLTLEKSLLESVARVTFLFLFHRSILITIKHPMSAKTKRTRINVTITMLLSVWTSAIKQTKKIIRFKILKQCQLYVGFTDFKLYSLETLTTMTIKVYAMTK